mgnify:CR=1 FL=1
MGRKEDNDKVLRGGFARLAMGKDTEIERIMYDVLDKALDALHEAHNVHGRMRHEEETNTLGWALVHNGHVVEAVSQSKGPWTPRGDALGRLQQVVAEGPKLGWYGIVLSDMANNWYRVDYEIDFLHQSADSVIMNMRDHLHRI